MAQPRPDNPAMDTIPFVLRGAHIPLDALLKASGLAESGGRAKTLIVDGLVQVDGSVELRKTCKIRAGQRVRLAEREILVEAGQD